MTETSKLYVPDRTLLCAWCDELVYEYGVKRRNADGNAHRCQGYLNQRRRERGI